MHFHIPYHSNLERYPTKLLALYHALRDSIVEGVLERGTRLPSTRELASAYGLSRGTVNQVYEMLAAEGYVDCRTGSGTYVAFRRSTRTSGAGAAAARPEEAPAYPLSPWSRRLGPPPGEPVHGGGKPPRAGPAPARSSTSTTSRRTSAASRAKSGTAACTRRCGESRRPG
ncbi:winged helix-turn-helix domain-containing protein [Paenibacillus mucilaginosus]|uniref:winged helix-turn-helix domain-containing protein n=1 Tax=Paenibacillus mucilaginosus TaxID=61624 RepID=UPI00240E5A5E|nr:winged helix-turn-helix domain-containing protein [Paenibacillus mucilaginosus]